MAWEKKTSTLQNMFSIYKQKQKRTKKYRQDKLGPRAKAQLPLSQARVPAAMLCIPGMSTREPKSMRIQSPGFYAKPCPASTIKLNLTKYLQTFFRVHIFTSQATW